VANHTIEKQSKKKHATADKRGVRLNFYNTVSFTLFTMKKKHQHTQVLNM